MNNRSKPALTDFPFKSAIMIAVVLIPVLIFHWYTYGQGLFFTNDSHHYLSASQSFKSSSGFVDSDNNYLLFWPPLFPIIISTINAPEQLFRYVNMALVVIIAISVFRITRIVIRSKVLAFLCFIFVLTGVQLLLIASYFWSELIFLTLTLVFVETLLRYPANKRLIYVTIFVGFLLCLQRNAGVFIALGASLWLHFQRRNTIDKSVEPLAFFLFVVSGSIVWNFYVWILLSHDQFSFSEALFQNASYNLGSMSSALVGTFLPIRNFSTPILIAAFAIFIYALKSHIAINHAFQLLFMLSITYLCFLSLVLVVNIEGYRIDFGEGERFVSVIIPLVGIMVFQSMEFYLDRLKKPAKKVLVVLIVLWLVYPVSRTVKNAKQWHAIPRVSAVKEKIEKLDLLYLTGQKEKRFRARPN